MYNSSMSKYLKYYTDEDAKYGDMGALSEAQMVDILERITTKYVVSRVKLVVSNRAKNTCRYTPGLGIVTPNRRLARPLDLPTIVMSKNMMNWRFLLHEVAHHIHYMRYHNDAAQFLLASNLNVNDTSAVSRYQIREYVRSNMKAQHSHGKIHAAIMQELVTLFLSELGRPPTYLAPKPSSPTITSIDGTVRIVGTAEQLRTLLLPSEAA